VSEDAEKYLKGSWLAKLVSVHERPVRVFALEHGRLKGVQFAVRWISADARAKAINEARKYLTTHCGWDPVDLYSGAGASSLEFESRVRLLAIALVDPAAPSTAAASSADELRGLFDSEEIQRLFEEWDAFQLERSPWRHWKTSEEFESDVDALGKGLMPEGWIRSFESASLRSIVTSLVDRLRKQTKDSSPAISPPKGSGDESTTDD
jgi:hypothetical protein